MCLNVCQLLFLSPYNVHVWVFILSSHSFQKELKFLCWKKTKNKETWKMSIHITIFRLNAYKNLTFVSFSFFRWVWYKLLFFQKLIVDTRQRLDSISLFGFIKRKFRFDFYFYVPSTNIIHWCVKNKVKIF